MAIALRAKTKSVEQKGSPSASEQDIGSGRFPVRISGMEGTNDQGGFSMSPYPIPFLDSDGKIGSGLAIK